MMLGNKADIFDYVDLALLRLAKVNRQKIASEAGSKEFYEEFFTENDEHSFAVDGDPRRRHRGKLLREAVRANTPDGGRFLDVGCGTGDNLRYVMFPGVEFQGLEYAESTALMARRLLGGSVKIDQGSATAIPFPDASFDTLMCIEVLEHIEQDQAALAEISRVAKPGGKFILSLPYRHWFPSYFSLMGHYRHYTRSDVVSQLAGHGFDVVSYVENYPRWARWANYCFVTARAYTLLLRVFGKKYAAADVPAPFSKRKLLDVLFGWIEPVRQKEIGIDYSKLETSTLVIAEKRRAGA